MDWARARLVVFVATAVALAMAVAGGPAVAFAVPLLYIGFAFAVGDAVHVVASAVRSGRGFRGMSNMVGAGISLIFTIISVIISFIIVAKMFPLINDASYQLQQSAMNSTNTLIQMLAPVIPYLIGIGLFVVILLPINAIVDRLGRSIGRGRI